MTTPTDDELLALAKKATPGPWREGTANVWRDTMVICDLGRGTRYVYEQGRRIPVSGNDEKWQDDAAYIAAANPSAIISLIERHRAEVEELRQRVGFIESKVDIEDMPDHYAWAVNELTARKAYSKAECATLIAEQRAEVERLTRENNNLSAGQKHALESCWAAESALAAERKRCGELEGAGADLDALIVRAQEKLCAWLHPDSAHDERECMNELLEMFDGPRQREIQSAWRKATGVK